MATEGETFMGGATAAPEFRSEAAREMAAQMERDAKRARTGASGASDDLQAVLDSACGAALAAGRLMKQHVGRTEVAQTKSNATDLVTVVDKQCQEAIEAYMRRHHPGHVLLGEEDVAPGSEASAAALERYLAEEWLWIVDPIDGTTNFVHGLPASVVSIAVAHRGEVVVGVILDPYRDELFTAVRGRGAFLNGERLAVDPCDSFREALVAFGIGTKDEVRLPMLRGVGAVSGECRSIRDLGSAAVHMAWVACARLTVFWELDLNSWDIAAGALIITEAGGHCCDTRGEPFSLRTRDIVALNGSAAVRGRLLELLESSNGASVGV